MLTGIDKVRDQTLVLENGVHHGLVSLVTLRVKKMTF